MKIQEIFKTNDQTLLSYNQKRLLQSSCNHFINSTNTPLLKNILGKDETFIKSKVRFHKRHNDLISAFNEALSEKYQISNIHQRAIFANGPASFVPNEESCTYYIFPINGYKFLYNKQVQNCNQQFKNTFEVLLREFNEDNQQATEIIKEILSSTYVSENLEQGIVEGSEILIYNIPYYYAISASDFPSYQALLNVLQDKKCQT
jgi:hypothetical protein